ncbi:MAG TPA: outer membrane beta-barrel protein [Candidatus Binatia bacterium]|nr:outer membrane beta-barrel protein [Candidatus Binatia bacterium]
MTLRRLLPVVFVLAFLPMFVPDGHAAPRRYSTRGSGEAYEIAAYLTFNDFSNRMELDDDGGAGARFGYLYNTHHEIEFLFNSVNADDSFNFGENADIDNLQVAYVLNLNDTNVVPYLTAGLGLVHTDDSFLGSETDPVLGLGGGVRFFLGRVTYARFELRANFFEGDGQVYANGTDFSFKELAFGIGWRIPTR